MQTRCIPLRSILSLRNLVWASITLIVLGVLLILAIKNVPTAGGFSNPSAPAAAGGTPTLAPEAFCAQWFMLGPELPPEKHAAEEMQYQRCVEARKSPASAAERANAPRPRLGNTPAPTPPPYIPPADLPSRAGGDGTIVDDGSSLFPLNYIANQWWVMRGGKWIRVFAGAVQTDGVTILPRPWQGEVIVAVSTLDGLTFFLAECGTYKTPSKVGPVKIVDAQGERLVLLAEDGTTLYFDVPARRFVASLAEVVPTATPAPPATPQVPAYP
jgi:hypothetical protein